MKAPDPITHDIVPPEWIAERREIITRDRYAVRGGLVGVDLAGQPFKIEVQARSGEWLLLTLPGGSTTFTTAADRDAVLRDLISTPTKTQ